jgi:phosphatidylglycerophosphate synthase
MASGVARWPLVLQIPNALTALRLVVGLAFPWAPASRRLMLLIVAALTEALDGTLARLLDAQSRTGLVLDPIADKVFVLGAFAALVKDGTVPAPAALGLVGRDLLVLAGAAWVVLRHGRAGLHRMPPRVLGKLTTAVQLGLLLVLIGRPGTAVPPALYAAAAALSVAAGLDYLRHFR